jgi:SAM-dependent methyltransferase
MTGSSGAFHEFERAGWEKAATEYDHRFGELTMQAIGPLLDAAGAAPGLRLLDVACGPGYVASAAARRGSSVVGLDFSTAMVAIARAANPELEFLEGDAEKLDLPDCSFDAVVMNFGMLHLDRPESAIAEAFRVLRPGGRYAFTVWDVPEKAVAFGIILGAIQSHGNMNVPMPAGPSFFRFSDPEESKRTLTAQGFINVQSLQVPQFWRLASGEALLETFQTAAVRTGALLNAQAPSALQKIQGEISLRIETFRNHDDIVLPMPAILASALRPASV